MTEAQNVLDLRAALAQGGRVTIPAGRYYFNDTLVIDRQTIVEGAGQDSTTLDFTRMTDPTKEAIRIDRAWGYEISNIAIAGNRTLNSIGVLNSTNTPNANGSYGTCSGSAIWSHVMIYGFKKGVVVGDGSRYIAASEVVYVQLKIVMCDTCFELNDYNTLNHRFILPQFGDCNVGLRTNGASYVAIDGGSFSACRGILFDMVQCNAARFRDCRMEDSGVFLRCGTTSTAGNTIVEGCLIHQKANFATDNTSAYANGWKSAIVVGGSHVLRVSDTFISSTVPGWPAVYSLTKGLVEATGNTCNIDPSGPLFVGPNKTLFVQSLAAAPTGKVYTRNNMWTDSGQVLKGWYPDQSN